MSVLERLGEWREECLDYAPPRNGRKIRVDNEYIVAFMNDGSELWIGTPERWIWFCSWRDAMKIVRFVLYEWVRGWFGLRRWLWYWDLSRRVARHRAPE